MYVAAAGARPRDDAPRAGARFALLVLFAVNLVNFFDRQLLGSLGEPIRREFQLSDTQLALLGTVFTLVYALIGLPLGSLSDRWYRNRLLAISIAVWSLVTAATGLAHNYLQLFAARMGVGVGEAVCAPAGQSLIGDFFPPRQRAKAMGIFMLGLPTGVALAYVAAGTVGAQWGWRAAFAFAAIPGLILAGLVLCVREPARDGWFTGEAQTGALQISAALAGAARAGAIRAGWLRYRAVLAVPTMWWITLSGIFHTFTMFAIASFNAPYLQRFHHLSLHAASLVSSIAVGAVGILGLLGGGYLADRVSAVKPNGKLLVPAWAMSIAAPCILFAVEQPPGSIVAYVALMSVATIHMYVYYATVYAAIQDVIEPRLRGSAVALYFCAMYVLGASMGPLGTGILSDHFARAAMQAAGARTMAEVFKAAGLHQAMLALPLLSLIAALVLYAAAHSMTRDLPRKTTPRRI